MPDNSANPPAPKISRGGFLRIAASLGIAGATAGLMRGGLLPESRVEQSRLIMGTIANLSLVVPDGRTEGLAREAIEACFTRMEALESLLSRFQSGSQVSRLNREGSLSDPHPVLVELIRRSGQLQEASGGAFDITILPVLRLYQTRQAQGAGLPSELEIEAALRKVGSEKLEATPARIRFGMPGMGITLDGIAKGYIVEAGVEQLRRHGFSDVLVEAGGDLVASGRREDGGAWQIGVQPARPGSPKPAAQFALHDQAAATSGDYWQYFSPDHAQHHILNPATGKSSPSLASATVIAPDLTLADALATALMVMEPEKGRRLALSLGCEVYFIPKGPAHG